jgi:hypothetical protein
MLRDNTYPRRAPTEVLWGDSAPFEHSLQIYADEGLFVDALEGFVSGGLRVGEGLIVIATAAHRRALERRLVARGYDVDLARAQDRYIPVDAAAALSQFMVNGWPDNARFNQLIAEYVARASGNGQRVRAFGEMVAILWNQGEQSATLQLEDLWNRFIERQPISLFCAYPRMGFAPEAGESFAQICSHHSRVIPE